MPPVVVALAVIVAVVPRLFPGGFVGNFSTWFYRALMFLVVSLSLCAGRLRALTVFSGIGGASRKGILVKGSNYGTLARAKVIAFRQDRHNDEGVFEGCGSASQ